MPGSTLSLPILSRRAVDPPQPSARAQRLHLLVTQHFQWVWRSLRRLGVRADNVDDAAQQVFLVASRRLEAIESGREASFLFGTCIRVAGEFRQQRGYGRGRELHDESAIESCCDGRSSPEELVEREDRRRILDAILDSMPDDLRIAFILFELENLTAVQIAEFLQVPAGTVASRVRRAREHFHREAERWRARMVFRGGGR